MRRCLKPDFGQLNATEIRALSGSLLVRLWQSCRLRTSAVRRTQKPSYTHNAQPGCSELFVSESCAIGAMPGSEPIRQLFILLAYSRCTRRILHGKLRHAMATTMSSKKVHWPSFVFELWAPKAVSMLRALAIPYPCEDHFGTHNLLELYPDISQRAGLQSGPPAGQDTLQLSDN